LVLEVLILLYYLNRFKFLLLFIFILLGYFTYIITIKNILDKEKSIKIFKGENLKKISYEFIQDKNYFDQNIYLIIFKFYNNIISNIHYGEFFIDNNSSFLDIMKIITQPSNVVNKIQIIEGWQKFNLNEYLKKFYDDDIEINYLDILADTYIIKSGNSLKNLIKLMKVNTNEFFEKHKNSELLIKYSMKDIIIIASLLEKEGLDYDDKRLISSVIFNRLNKGMKLQIDATTIFALTNGQHKLERKLSFKDLKLKHPYNTYFIHGLPPNPICFVGRKTIEIVLENYMTNYLFYFYDKFQNKHIFSTNYEQHKLKLHAYRKK